MELLHPDSARALERENRELREELRKRAEQQTIMEQIVGNVSSLLDGSSDAMCIFDKDGYFLHINNACRRILGLVDSQHPTRSSLFEVYSPRDRDRVIREFFSKPTTKWTGPITIHNKHTGFENSVIQTIEALSSKHTSEAVFFKSYFTPQSRDDINDKIRIYGDMINHMPHGVGIWRLERGPTTPAVLRLACANKLAAQYVGVPLLPGSLVHEILPNGPGLEVHRFLEDVVRTQRVIALDAFRIGPLSFSVTAYPLYPDFVVVIMDPPKGSSTATPASPSPTSPITTKDKDSDWSNFVSSSGLGIAACEGTQVLHANEHLAGMLSVPQAYLKGRDLLAVLDTRVRSSARSQLEQLRRAIRERVIHHVEVELELFAWRISVHPMGEGSRQTLIVAHRTRTLAPQTQSQSQRPMFPILPSSFPSSSPSSSFNEPKSSSDISLYKDTIDLIPCGILIMKTEESSDSVRPQFRVVSLNQAAQALPVAKGLTPGHRFDELTSPFDPAFLRALLSASKSQEGRVAIAGEKQGARIVPLNDSAHVAIMFEDTSIFDKFESPSILSPRSANAASAKRGITDLADAVDRGYLILPNSHQPPTKYLRTPCKQENNEMVLPFSSKSTAHSILPPLQPLSQSPFVQPFSPSPSPSLSITPRNDKFERIVQNCVVGIACTDSTGYITLANKTFGQMLGYPESELGPSTSVSDILHPDDAAQARGVIRQVASGETQSVDLPLRFVHNVSHNVVWAVASFMQMEKGVLVQVQQPTKLKNFPEVLLSDRDILRATFREIVVGTAVLDVEDRPRIVSANGGFCAIMAGTESELTGHALTDMLHPDDCEAVLTVAHDLVALRAQRSQLLSVRSNPRSGPARYGALSLSAVLDSKSSPFLLIAQLQLVDKPFS